MANRGSTEIHMCNFIAAYNLRVRGSTASQHGRAAEN